ncbi:DAK2 domain-containing protein [Anaerobacillus sp. MEB173]|uniref:DAK2 domain-containing protein n=1 Tax=Anaerobacillus sp. MEB173 TaxID=3383345 RepID=UPI003F92DF5F
MTILKLEGKKFAQMIIEGANNLTIHVKKVDALNVFPVPDGDTGTNMNLSMTSGVKEVKQKLSEHVGHVATTFSKGLLMGARGNSGVILSQLFRGFAKAVEDKEIIDAKQFAKAFDLGVETAYRAVMKPVEGTILTVAKDAAKQAVNTAKNEEDIIIIMSELLKEARASLKRTPDLLPVLKEVGVVDSGGQGLVYIYEGFLAVLKGEQIETNEQTLPMEEMVKIEHHHAQSQLATEDIEFGYCTEFMVRFEEEKVKKQAFDEQLFRQQLSNFGDSLLVVSDEDLVKVHIHAEEPGKVLSEGQRFGSLINIKIENMREQHTHILEETKAIYEKNSTNEIHTKKSPYAIIAVSMGSGIANLFKGLGAAYVIEGGQTMNPSTEDIVNAIRQSNAEEVFILPNNSNIVMAAEQAANVVEQQVTIIRSKSVPQGLAALLAFNPSSETAANEAAMTEAMKRVKTGQVTFAVRDTNIDGVEITEGDFMGIIENKIVTSGKALQSVTEELLTKIIDDDTEIVTMIQGEDVDDKLTEQLVNFIEDQFDDVEVEVHIGNQPLYSYIFSVE